MTDLVLPASHAARFARGSTAWVLAAVFLLVFLGDWLCFGRAPGAGAAIFAFCIVAATYGTAANRPAPRRRVSAAIIVLLAQIPWVLAPDAVAFGLSVLGTAAAAACLSGDGKELWPRTQVILTSMVWRIAPDLVRAWRGRIRFPAERRGAASLAGWLLPALGGALFLGLFADANPIIANALAVANPLAMLLALAPARPLFWLAIASAVWPFVATRAPAMGRVSASEPDRGKAWETLFGTVSITRALILFNLLFLLQTGLDAAYLWGGLTLPNGLTYASYAHRGAYPLILTALLAGGFAILATRPGSPSAASRAVRMLLLLWVVQNLALVGSSMFRLRLYVQVYSLSELRLATFIWMLLVFAGLVLIILRILLQRSDNWLLRANAIAAVFTIYCASCLNFPLIVAQYDVSHCREVTGSGAALDLDYLQSLGPQVIPALDRYQVITSIGDSAAFAQQGAAGAVRVALASGVSIAPTDWRSFSFWAWTLQCYLATHNPEGS